MLAIALGSTAKAAQADNDRQSVVVEVIQSPPSVIGCVPLLATFLLQAKFCSCSLRVFWYLPAIAPQLRPAFFRCDRLMFAELRVLRLNRFNRSCAARSGKAGSGALICQQSVRNLNICPG